MLIVIFRNWNKINKKVEIHVQSHANQSNVSNANNNA